MFKSISISPAKPEAIGNMMILLVAIEVGMIMAHSISKYIYVRHFLNSQFSSDSEDPCGSRW